MSRKLLRQTTISDMEILYLAESNFVDLYEHINELRVKILKNMIGIPEAMDFLCKIFISTTSSFIRIIHIACLFFYFPVLFCGTFFVFRTELSIQINEERKSILENGLNSSL